jgi:hypothetical protein
VPAAFGQPENSTFLKERIIIRHAGSLRPAPHSLVNRQSVIQPNSATIRWSQGAERLKILHRVIQELRYRCGSGHEQMIAGADAGDVKQRTLGVVSSTFLDHTRFGFTLSRCVSACRGPNWRDWNRRISSGVKSASFASCVAGSKIWDMIRSRTMSLSGDEALSSAA